MPSVAMVAEEEDRDMGRAPCVARNPTAYGQAGQKHGRTIPLGDVLRPKAPRTSTGSSAIPFPPYLISTPGLGFRGVVSVPLLFTEPDQPFVSIILPCHLGTP